VLLLLAATDGGVPSATPAGKGTESPPTTERRALSLSSVSGAPEFRDVQSGASTSGASTPGAAPTRAMTAGTAEEPATRIDVRERIPPRCGCRPRTDSRTVGRTDSGTPSTAPTPSASSEATNQALLEQSKAQTEAMQALLAQQQAQEQARVVEQQARTERAAAVQNVRDSIGGTVQALQTSGNWDPASLSQASTSLRRTAASANASGALGDASRASEAAGLVDAAQSALNQRSHNRRRWYLTAPRSCSAKRRWVAAADGRNAADRASEDGQRGSGALHSIT
jgi:hypothetical protein